MISSREEYEKRKKYYNDLIKKQRKLMRNMSNLRLIVFIFGVLSVAFMYIKEQYYLCGSFFLCSSILFFYIIKIHNEAIKKEKYYRLFYSINDDSIKRIGGEWKQFKDIGEEFLNEEHNYSKDLDIFGKNSIFQWINTTVTYLGREKLSNILKNPKKDTKSIYERQDSIEELSNKLDWRQNFIIEGSMERNKLNNPKKLFQWGKYRKKFYCNILLRIGLNIWNIVSILLIILPLIFSNVPYYVSAITIAINIMMLMYDNTERSEILATLDTYKESLKSYYGMIKVLQEETFTSNYLKKLKSNLVNNHGDIASKQIKKLARIEVWVSNRRNPYYFLMNLIMLFDYRCMISLEKWKRESGDYLEKWIDVIGEFEALSSLAIIKYDNPSWTNPKIVDERQVFEAEKMGHPLLTNNDRVCNDVHIKDKVKILLITGSNMSGKSTLLRTSGINLVLAYAGAPVCAEKFSCSIMEIYTCMRISDNLEKSISSFYAEILRIKKIVKAVSQNKKVFFLLDEIFKGTNSLDRHTGAKMLINKLNREGAIGFVSTHDLELGELEKESRETIKNYHLKEYYKDNKIYFDYKLRPGISDTRNALYLIKMAGIE